MGSGGMGGGMGSDGDDMDSGMGSDGDDMGSSDDGKDSQNLDLELQVLVQNQLLNLVHLNQFLHLLYLRQYY